MTKFVRDFDHASPVCELMRRLWLQIGGVSASLSLAWLVSCGGGDSDTYVGGTAGSAGQGAGGTTSGAGGKGSAGSAGSSSAGTTSSGGNGGTSSAGGSAGESSGGAAGSGGDGGASGSAGTGGSAGDGGAAGSGSGGTTPCTGFCNVVPMTIESVPFQSTTLGTGAGCFQYVGTLTGGNCYTFDPPRTFSINDQVMTCGETSFTTPPQHNGGYCIVYTSGSSTAATFRLF